MLDEDAQVGPPGAPGLDMVGFFDAQVSWELAEEIARIIRDEYRAANTVSASMYRGDQAREVMPRLRRAGLESQLLSLSRFPGVNTQSLRSSASSYYVQLDVGELLLVAARAQDPEKMIRKAMYRERIALQSAQRSLFGDEPIPPGARYFAIILHGSARKSVDPTFVVVRFPTSDHKTYLDVRIDLRERYASLFAAEVTTPVEEIQDTQTLTLRREKSTGSEDA